MGSPDMMEMWDEMALKIDGYDAMVAENAALAAHCAALEGAVEAVLAHLPDDEAMRGDGCSWTEYMETRDFEALRELVPALRAALAAPPVAAARRSFSTWETHLTWAEMQELYDWMSRLTLDAPPSPSAAP